MPKVFEFCSHPNYLYRGTTLLSVSALAPVVGPDVVDSTLLPLVLKLHEDVVPNIRFKVATTLGILAKYAEATVVQNRIRPALESLLNDSDKDVRYYANTAIRSLPSS